MYAPVASTWFPAACTRCCCSPEHCPPPFMSCLQLSIRDGLEITKLFPAENKTDYREQLRSSGMVSFTPCKPWFEGKTASRPSYVLSRLGVLRTRPCKPNSSSHFSPPPPPCSLATATCCRGWACCAARAARSSERSGAACWRCWGTC